MTATVAVVGGGIAGLALSFELLERSQRFPDGLDVRCFEAAERPGGNLQSTREEGFLFEWAANGFLDNAPATITLVRRIGLESRLLPANAAAERRYIFRRGRLREVPTTPLAFLRSGLLPPWGLLRVLGEPLVPRRADDAGDESIHDFAARRIGSPAANVLIDAMVSGIHAGDTRRLSLEATFPKMRRMEQEHGGLFRAMLAKRKQAGGGGPAGPGGRLTSFTGGMQELPDALAGALGDRLRLGCPIERLSDLGNRGFRLHPREGAPIDVDGVVLACPAWSAAPLLAPLDGAIALALESIGSAPVAVVHVGYRTAALGDQPEGFGFLVPRAEGRRMLGALWSSNIFPGRAPEGSRLITVMIGGAHDPQALELDDTALLQLARNDLQATMGIEAAPYFTRIVRHRRGIAQYELGHAERLDTIERRLASHAGLWVCGSSYRGIAVNACVEEAPHMAESVLEFLTARARAAG